MGQCKVYRMKIFAKNKVVARSRFWYFMGRLCRVKKANGQIVSVNQIFEKTPEKVKNFGIWFRYDSRTGTHNAYKENREVALTDAVNSLYHRPVPHAKDQVPAPPPHRQDAEGLQDHLQGVVREDLLRLDGYTAMLI